VRLVVAIVAWRCADLAIEAVASLEDEREDFESLHVVLVDNDSGDGTADALEAAVMDRGWSAWVHLVRAPRNGGFAYGNNLALGHALREGLPLDRLLLLNPDTYVRRGAVRALSDFLDEHPEVGLVGGRSEDPDGTPQVCAFRFPTIIGEGLAHLRFGPLDRLLESRLTRVGVPEEPMEVDWVSGAFLMIRLEVIEAVGFLDEAYFLYYEETDFCLRAVRHGWRCWHVPSARVVHLVGTSSGVSTNHIRQARRPAYWFESRRRYFVLNHGLAYAMAVDLATLIGQGVHGLRMFVQRRHSGDPPSFARDLVRLGALGRLGRSLPERRIGP
jgi:GT2 family glycosyltransferase